MAHPDPRRRRVRRPGPGGRDARPISQLIGYRTGGTIHIVVNNQIGFTTVPAHAVPASIAPTSPRSVQAPILHVNGDEPEAVVFVARIAAEFRMQFGTDIVIDIVCYRRHGHNEADEPAFTQPIMYRAIKDRPTTRELYAERLAAEGAVSKDEVAADVATTFQARLEDAFEAAKSYRPNKADWLEGHWTGLKPAGERRGAHEAPTAVSGGELQEVGARAVTRRRPISTSTRRSRVSSRPSAP